MKSLFPIFVPPTQTQKFQKYPNVPGKQSCFKNKLERSLEKQRVFETPSVSISGVLTPIEGLEKFRQELTLS